jgi:clan AA aspartic protease
MIAGTVTSRREATIRLTVLDASGQQHDIQVVIDTGFTGSLTLPPSDIAAWGLSWRSRGRALLANGSVERFDIYAATVIWNGTPRHVLAEAANTDPLVGMTLLYGHDLHIEAIDGGQVTIVERP